MYSWFAGNYSVSVLFWRAVQEQQESEDELTDVLTDSSTLFTGRENISSSSSSTSSSSQTD